MVSEKSLISNMSREGISCFKVELAINIVDNNSIILKNNDINVLIEFMKLNNIKSAFYEYYFYEELIENNYGILESKRNEHLLKEESLKEESKKYVLNDENFKKCTNEKLRRSYLYSVFNSEEVMKYKRVFIGPRGIANAIAYNLIELLWREYKHSKL